MGTTIYVGNYSLGKTHRDIDFGLGYSIHEKTFELIGEEEPHNQIMCQLKYLKMARCWTKYQ